MDDFNDDYFDDWCDFEAELQMENNKTSLGFDLDYKTFNRLSEKNKIDYLYYKISDLYSYLSTIQDVV